MSQEPNAKHLVAFSHNFESSNPQMIGAFFATNATTVLFTCEAYDLKGGE